jgi:hypothetical protein
MRSQIQFPRVRVFSFEICRVSTSSVVYPTLFYYALKQLPNIICGFKWAIRALGVGADKVP